MGRARPPKGSSRCPLVESLRSAVGDRDIRADVNGAWTPRTAKRQLSRLVALNLADVEQPFELDDLARHAALRQSQAVPIALDESAYTLADVGNIVRAGTADVVLLDRHEAGGLWQVVKQAATCAAVGIPVSLHSGDVLALSQAAYAHLAVSIANCRWRSTRCRPTSPATSPETAPAHRRRFRGSDGA